MHAEARPSEEGVGAVPGPAIALFLCVVTVVVANQFATRDAPWLLLASGLALIACLGRASAAEAPAGGASYVGLAGGVLVALLAGSGATGDNLRQVCAGVICILGLEFGTTNKREGLDPRRNHAVVCAVVLAGSLACSISSWPASVAVVAALGIAHRRPWTFRLAVLAAVALAIASLVPMQARPPSRALVPVLLAHFTPRPWLWLTFALVLTPALLLAVGRRANSEEKDAEASAGAAGVFWVVLAFVLNDDSSLSTVTPMLGLLIGSRFDRSLRRKSGLPKVFRTDQRTLKVALGVGVFAASCLFALDVWFVCNAGYLSMDEGYVAAFASAMLHGKFLPYVDAVSHRGPLLYWAVGAAQALFGEFSWAGLRWLSTASHLVTVGAVAATAWVVGRPLAGAIAAVLVACIVGVAAPPVAGLALGGETLGSAFVALGLFFATATYRRPDRAVVLAIASGFCVGLGVLTKQTLLLSALPVLGLIVASALRSGARPFRGAARWLGGFFAPLFGVVTLYAAHSHLDTLVYWLIRYNAEIYMKPYEGMSIWKALRVWADDATDEVTVALLVLSASLFAVVTIGFDVARSLRARRSADSTSASDVRLVASLLVVLSIVAAVAPLRFWWHYFMAVVPWISLALGLRLEEYARNVLDGAWATRAAHYALFTPFVVLLVLAFGTRLGRLEEERRVNHWEKPADDPICHVVDRYSKPDQRILVWGFDGDVYVSCARPPATKYIYHTMVMGIVPPFWHLQDDRWVAPGAREDAAREIERFKPPVILENRTHYKGRSLLLLPAVSEAVKRDYCAPVSVASPARVVGANTRLWHVYVRKDLGCTLKSEQRELLRPIPGPR